MSHSAWEDHRWNALPHLQGVVRADVCVVGLGGSGLSAIAAALDHGLTVVGIDAAGVGGGAAGANGGLLLAGSARFYHQCIAILGRERTCQLYRLTLDEIDRMAALAPDLVRRTGSLRIADDVAEYADCLRQFAAMRADDLPVELYEGTEGRGLLMPYDAAFQPLAYCRRLAVSALGRGARLYEHTHAQSVRAQSMDGGVATPQGRVRCRFVIVAVDGKLESIVPELTGRVRTARLQMLGTAPTDEVRLERPVYARFGYDYWQQLSDGRVLLGGCRDLAPLDEEWTHSTETTSAVQDLLTRRLRDHLHVQAPITHRWAASVGFTDNGLPIVEQVRPNVWVLGGYNGTGNVIGALCGRAAVDSLVGQPSALPTLSSGLECPSIV